MAAAAATDCFVDLVAVVIVVAVAAAPVAVVVIVNALLFDLVDAETIVVARATAAGTDSCDDGNADILGAVDLTVVVKCFVCEGRLESIFVMIT